MHRHPHLKTALTCMYAGHQGSSGSNRRQGSRRSTRRLRQFSGKELDYALGPLVQKQACASRYACVNVKMKMKKRAIPASEWAQKSVNSSVTHSQGKLALVHQPGTSINCGRFLELLAQFSRSMAAGPSFGTDDLESDSHTLLSSTSIISTMCVAGAKPVAFQSRHETHRDIVPGCPSDDHRTQPSSVQRARLYRVTLGIYSTRRQWANCNH